MSCYFSAYILVLPLCMSVTYTHTSQIIFKSPWKSSMMTSVGLDLWKAVFVYHLSYLFLRTTFKTQFPLFKWEIWDLEQLSYFCKTHWVGDKVLPSKASVVNLEKLSCWGRLLMLWLLECLQSYGMVIVYDELT